MPDPSGEYDETRGCRPQNVMGLLTETPFPALCEEHVLFLISYINVLYLSQAYDSTQTLTIRKRGTEAQHQSPPKVHSQAIHPHELREKKENRETKTGERTKEGKKQNDQEDYLSSKTPCLIFPTPVHSRKFNTASTNRPTTVF